MHLLDLLRNYICLLKLPFLASFPLTLIFNPLSCEDALIGKIVSSQIAEYQVIKKLGEGTYGKVYAVQDPFGSCFALKFYDEYKNDYENIEREFEHSLRLCHPNIINSIELIKTSDQKYLVLELVKGYTLAECPKKFLSGEEAIQASLQLIDSLLHALSLEFVYLSLKSNNIMINENKKIKIIDVASFVNFDEIDKHYFGDKLVKSISRFEPLLIKNFDKVTTICVHLIDRSTLNRKERIDKKEAIKKLAWNCEEDFQEKKEIRIEDYLNQLRELLTSFINQ